MRIAENIRIAVGLGILIGTVLLAHHFQMKRYEEELVRYKNCLAAGLKPKICSVVSVFSPTRFN